MAAASRRQPGKLQKSTVSGLKSLHLLRDLVALVKFAEIFRGKWSESDRVVWAQGLCDASDHVCPKEASCCVCNYGRWRRILGRELAFVFCWVACNHVQRRRQWRFVL
jgi:hypothetical protein